MRVSSPHTFRDAQGMNGKLTTLSWFISKLAEKFMPLFQAIKGCIEKSNFQWTPAVEAALRNLKETFSQTANVG